MKGDPLPGDDHVVRQARFKDIDNGKVLGSAFVLRAGEAGLSVNWLECFGDRPRDRQLAEIRRLARLRVGKQWRFAALNVRRTVAHVAGEGIDISFIEDPLDTAEGFEADPSHSLIMGLPDADSELAELVGDMIRQCVEAEYPAVAA